MIPFENELTFIRILKGEAMRLKFLFVMFIITNLFAISPYIDGYKMYIRYVKHIPKYGIKAPVLLKKLNVKTPNELNALFQNNAEKLILQTQKFNSEAAKGLEKIIKKGKLSSLKAFFLGIINGKIPPG